MKKVKINKQKISFLFAGFILLFLICLETPVFARDKGLVAWWKFDQIKKNQTQDSASQIEDIIEGNFKLVSGVAGSALKLDGFTTCVIRQAGNSPRLEDRFTLESWLALATYPWNWCPIISQKKGKEAGFYFAIGPRGQLTFQIALNGKWQECSSPDFAIPLRKWVHAAAVYDSAEGITIYLDGKQVGQLAVKGKPTFSPDVDLRIGMNHEKMKPAYIHREHGTLPDWFSLDGIVDEIKIYDQAITPEQVMSSYSKNKPGVDPDLPPRLMPSGPAGPGRFGAYYCKLKFYDEWDALWPVDEHLTWS
jgi:hypothetical protein